MKTAVAGGLLIALVSAVPALAQTSQRLWYAGPFEGRVEVKTNPAYGYYYQPSPATAYPLNEQAYGSPIPCRLCGHSHFPGQDLCPTCGARCSGCGNRENPTTVYSPRPLPGQYYFKEQAHYRFKSPMRLGWPYQKYTEMHDLPYND